MTATEEGMDPKRFWDLIAASSRPTQEEQLQALQTELYPSGERYCYPILVRKGGASSRHVG